MSNSVLHSIPYRAEIDGLRGLAVLAVILYHADLFVPGGYVGVDVFFVISGYLLTGIIVSDINHGTFSFLSFWERRARRILPPVTFVVLTVLATGWFLLLPQDLIDLGQSAISQALFAANLHLFDTTTGYFARAAEESPLLHTWSLAVEEQFYFVLPIVLLLIHRFTRSRFEWLLPLILVAAITSSFYLSVCQMAIEPARAFYLLPARAWELLCGSLVAVLPIRALPYDRLVRETAAIAGAIAVVAPMFLYRKGTSFPGSAAIPPCVGTAMFIWSASQASHSNHVPLLVRILSHKALTAVGLISYSLYLWHWPLLVFARYTCVFPLRFPVRVGLVLAAFALASLSWWQIETPFRRKRYCPSRRSMLSWSVCSAAAVILIGYSIDMNHGFRSRFMEPTLVLADAETDVEFYNEMTISDIVDERLIRIGDPRPDLPATVLVWGDSHAMAMLPAINICLQEMELAGLAATRSVFPPVAPSDPALLGPHRTEFSAAVLDFALRRGIPNVVMIGNWHLYREDKGFEGALLETIRQLRNSGTRVHLMETVPLQEAKVPQNLARSTVFRFDPTLLDTPAKPNGNLSVLDMEAIRSAGCHALDPCPLFLNDAKDRYETIRNGVVLYRDKNHLTASGAKLILLPWLRTEFGPALKRIDD